MSNKTEIKDKKRGLIDGYEPNRISLYLALLNTGRYDDLDRLLWNDMEKHKVIIDEENQKSKLTMKPQTVVCDNSMSGDKKIDSIPMPVYCHNNNNVKHYDFEEMANELENRICKTLNRNVLITLSEV